MPGYRFGGAFVDVGVKYKAGDPPPDGYIDWHNWAAVQGTQSKCSRCSLWRFPQEMSDESGVCRRCIVKTATPPEQPQLAP